MTLLAIPNTPKPPREILRGISESGLKRSSVTYVMEQRECVNCKQVKDLAPTNFYVDRVRGKNGFRVTCKVCEGTKKGVKQINVVHSEEKKEEARQREHDRKREKMTCECGAIVRRDGMSRHLKNPTTQHQNYLNRIAKA